MIEYNIVYKTTNLINGKIYVGKHIQYDTSAFDGYLGSGTLLWEAIESYGIENFKRETIEFCESEKISFQRENYWVEMLSARDLNVGYNIQIGGYGFTSEQLKDIRKDPKFIEKVSRLTTGSNNPASIYHYILKSPDGTMFETDCLAEFCRNHGLNRGLMNMVMNGKRNHHRKWTSISKKLKTENKKPYIILTNSEKLLKIKEEKISKIKEYYRSTEYREKRILSNTQAQNRPEVSEKKSNSLKERWKDQQFRESQLLAYNSVEGKLNRSNANKGTNNPQAKYHYILEDPFGKIWETECLNIFCKEHNLRQSNVTNLFSGKIKTSMGWKGISKTVRENKNGKV
jgi:hypothetical protein